MSNSKLQIIMDELVQFKEEMLDGYTDDPTKYRRIGYIECIETIKGHLKR